MAADRFKWGDALFSGDVIFAAAAVVVVDFAVVLLFLS